MIIELNKDKIKIHPMVIPELVNRTFIQYIYEAGTDHLHPKLTINRTVFIGDKLFIDMSPGFPTGKVKIKVELLDGSGRVVRSYTDESECFNYQVFGNKPVRPDIEVYIQNLKDTIGQQSKLIKALDEKGEVI